MSVEINKRVINTVTTGRSGTHYLARILGYLPDADVFHESLEHPYHECLRQVQQDQGLARKFLLEKTVPFIKRCPSSVFIETSHLFCKGFLEAFVELGGRPDLIVLRRDKRKIAKSLFKLGTIPGHQEKALQFYLSLEDPGVWRPSNWRKLDHYEICYWYCLEIERRAKVYRDLVFGYGGRVCEIDLDELTSVAGYRRLVQEMDLAGPNMIGWLKFFKNRKRRAGNFDAMKAKDPRPELDGLDEKEQAMDAEFASFMKQTNGKLER